MNKVDVVGQVNHLDNLNLARKFLVIMKIEKMNNAIQFIKTSTYSGIL